MNPNMRQSSGKKMLQQTAEHKKGTREVPSAERTQASKEMSALNKITRSLRSPKGPGTVKKRDYHGERGTPRNTKAERC